MLRIPITREFGLERLQKYEFPCRYFLLCVGQSSKLARLLLNQFQRMWTKWPQFSGMRPSKRPGLPAEETRMRPACLPQADSYTPPQTVPYPGKEMVAFAKWEGEWELVPLGAAACGVCSPWSVAGRWGSEEGP